MSTLSSALNANIPPPPDLTPYIVKVGDQYVAGGSFGDVYRCWCNDDSPKEVAVKAFRFRFKMDGNSSDRSARMLRRELGIWRRLDHPNVVPFLGIAYGFGMDGAMSLVSLWMPNESLHRFLARFERNLDLGHRLKFLLDIANGLHYCGWLSHFQNHKKRYIAVHSFPIVHGDLNCNNVFLDTDYTARLADFGYASLAGNIPEALAYLERTTLRPGALRWSAPEQVNAEEAFSRTPKSDIYSFGCIALQVLSGKQPWSEVREDIAIVFRLARGLKAGRPKSRTLDDSHWSLIQHCWSPIEERPAAETIISTVRRFLNDSPRSSSLRDSLSSWSSHVDPLVDEWSSSLIEASNVLLPPPCLPGSGGPPAPCNTEQLLASSSPVLSIDAPNKDGAPHLHSVPEELTIHRRVCEAMYVVGSIKDAGKSLLELVNTFRKEVYTSGPLTEWVSDFTQQCLSIPDAVYPHTSIFRPGLDSLTPIPLLREWAKATLLCSSWKRALAVANSFVVRRGMIYRAICERLEIMDRVTDASDCYHRMVDELAEWESVHDGQSGWALDFKSRCSRKLEDLGDAEMSVGQHTDAVLHYSAALALEPAAPHVLFVKRSKAYMAGGLWRQALDDADKVVELRQEFYSLAIAREHVAKEREDIIQLVV